jgi:hypothetical protein
MYKDVAVSLYKIIINDVRQNIRRVGVGVMVFSVTFNNISVVSWRLVLLEETRVNYRPVASQ